MELSLVWAFNLLLMYLSDLRCYGLTSRWAHFHLLSAWRPSSDKGESKKERKSEEERRPQIALQLNLKWKLMENTPERESGVGKALARNKRQIIAAWKIFFCQVDVSMRCTSQQYAAISAHVQNWTVNFTERQFATYSKNLSLSQTHTWRQI